MGIGCPHCHYESDYGVRVCIGCKAEIIYGSTASEKKNYFIGGGIGGVILGMAALDVVGIKGDLPAMGITFAVGAVVGSLLLYKIHGDSVRFFRTYRNL